MANGLCDNLLLSVYLSATCPVLVAPAMDEDMWKHPATRANIHKIASFGNIVLPVETGPLASGLDGAGRMLEPEGILDFTTEFFNKKARLAGRRVLISAGPTYEHIDPVRFIGNHSSGKMGVALAQQFNQQGATVTLVLGPAPGNFDFKGIDVIHVTSAQQMYDACTKAFKDADIAVMAAAVADYAPVTAATEKIKKSDGIWSLELTKTKDVLKTLGENKRGNQLLVGFALETNNEESNALAKLSNKNADIIVLNSLKDEKAGFGKDTNKITIFDRHGEQRAYEAKNKNLVAKDIIDYIITYAGV